jgi:molybdate transport system regulatory protein
MTRWRQKSASGLFLDERRVRLLEAIDQRGSIIRAAQLVPYSYKAAWDILNGMDKQAEQPLVRRAAGGRKGGGTRLTAHGHWVIAMYRALETECQTTLEHLTNRR